MTLWSVILFPSRINQTEDDSIIIWQPGETQPSEENIQKSWQLLFTIQMYYYYNCLVEKKKLVPK